MHTNVEKKKLEEGVIIQGDGKRTRSDVRLSKTNGKEGNCEWTRRAKRKTGEKDSERGDVREGTERERERVYLGRSRIEKTSREVETKGEP